MILSYLFSDPLIFFCILVAILIALTVHEYAHGLAALWLGDSTAQDQGRLTLNPLVHIDPIGFVMLLIAGFGWAKPVPYNPYNLRNQKWSEALVALAGPAANLALIALGLLHFQLLAYFPSLISSALPYFLLFLVHINIILLLFNLLPIPPLDGSKVLFSLLPSRYVKVRYFLESQGPIILIILLIADRMLPVSIFATLFSGVLNFVYSFINT